MSEWREVTIGELCEEGGGNVQTGPFGSQLKASAYVPNGIPTVMPANLVDFRISEEGIARISREDHQRLSKHHLRPGDIVYGRRGEIGRHALVTEKENGWLCGTGCLRIRFGDAEVEPRYVSYYLRQPEVIQMILGMAVGTTMPNLNTTIVKSIPLRLPPLPVQRRIAQILGRLDDKIEVNRRINRTLEAMARALYRHWFVDFGPFQDGEFVESELGLIPKGWEVKKLENVALINPANIRKGQEPKWIKYVDISSVSDGIINQVKPMVFAEAPSRARRLVSHGDIIWSAVRPERRAFSLIVHPDPELVVSTGFVVVRPVEIPYSYLYTTLATQKFTDWLAARATGAAYPAVKGSDFKNAPILVPEQDVLSRFHRLTMPLFEQRYILLRENRQLAAIRDYLLPKLLSGDAEP